MPGQPDRPAGTGEQRHAEIGLEPGDRPGQRGLRYAEEFGGAGEVLLAGDDGELAQPRHEGVERGFRLVGGLIHI